MASLHVFLCLLGLVALCNSACLFVPLEIKDMNNPPKGCTDRDGKQYDFGSEVVIDCMSCSCTNDGLSCCDMIPSPNTVMIPMECEMIVNRQACSFKLVLKSDNTKECSFF
ncbi:beta-microseminoprotein-like [Seriola lalandi dorsalis]|uniref:beta-microseminoprotein-like n=1 Tax=Seriola lalandi dorsalis TaxID=1841481 RepID=UPI000C6F5EE8|nr:beta-microseminoprotein-like [Seriola lalandi dorsalis]